MSMNKVSLLPTTSVNTTAIRPSELLLRFYRREPGESDLNTADIGFISSPTGSTTSSVSSISPSSELPNYDVLDVRGERQSSIPNNGSDPSTIGLGIGKFFSESVAGDFNDVVEVDEDDGGFGNRVQDNETQSPGSQRDIGIGRSNSSSSRSRRARQDRETQIDVSSDPLTQSSRVRSGTEPIPPDHGTQRPSHVSLLGGKYLLFLSPQGSGTSSNNGSHSESNPIPTTSTLSAPRTVQKCVNIETREQFMCKILPRTATGLGLLATYHRLSNFSDYVTPIHEVIMGPRLFYLIFPPNYGNVHTYLLAKKRFREEEAAKLFKQMVRSVEYCHNRGIVLRDLKLGKFVFVDKSRTKIRLESLEDAVLLENGRDDGLSDKHGCPNYVSPEKAEILRCQNRRYPGKSSDVWSLGIMLYTMLVGRYPFNDADHAKLFARIRKANFHMPEQLGGLAKCLIRCLLRKDPESRLTLKEIKKHPWVSGSERNNSTRLAGRGVSGSCFQIHPVSYRVQPQPTIIVNDGLSSISSGMEDDQVVPEFKPSN